MRCWQGLIRGRGLAAQVNRMSEARRRIGILGAGQLALMLAEAAPALGAEVVCAGARGDCAEQVASVIEVDLTDASAVAEFAKQVDLVTVESENIDAAVLEGLPLFPNAHAIGIAQERGLLVDDQRANREADGAGELQQDQQVAEPETRFR